MEKSMEKSNNIVVSKQQTNKKGITGKAYLAINTRNNKPVSVFIKSYFLINGENAKEKNVNHILSDEGYKVVKVFKTCILVFKHIEIKYKSFNVISNEFLEYENKKRTTSKTT